MESSAVPEAPAYTFTASQANAGPDQAKPARKNKRYRPPGPPFHDKLMSQSGKFMRVRLEVPEPDEECPLTLSPVADDALECLQPNTSWFQAFPSVKKMVLPCQHSFGALSILYHFARRNMICPCCRAGIDSPVSTFCMPSHLRLRLSTKVNSELRKEADERSGEDAQAAAILQSLQSDATIVLFPITVVQDISAGLELRVHFHGSQGSRAFRDIPTWTSVTLLPTWTTLRNLYDYDLQRDVREGRRSLDEEARDVRESRISPDEEVRSPRSNAFTLHDRQAWASLEESLRDNTVAEISFTAYMPILANQTPFRLVEVGSTDRIPLSRTGASNFRSVDAGRGARLYLDTSDGDSRLVDLAFGVPDSFLRFLSPI